MFPIEAAQLIARELVDKEKAKLVILSGSVARGKSNPSDLDIPAIFNPENNLQDPGYRRGLIRRLEGLVGFRLDLIDYNERYILSLIDNYREDPSRTCWHLNDLCFDNVRHQWKGWPLAWIFGEEAKEKLDPYLCFQEEFQVLEGQAYLEELRNRIKTT